ncbi:glycoside hydrolase family 19 protein [Cupriavidus numazuensis]|uniref:Uncharacterized protein n=1 Tax=Cupriavidus numazuensis TaxID=221992 RepID=A0ABN7Q9B7_9BURK|nr:glycoside hydrolase family 19 protein [Cupriavidus numazuensis]CAG2158130.1 hypothetical protein LMG26411_05850 [Cupriavidus numazuensis]
MANQTPTNSSDARVKQLRFAYPFRKKGQGNVAGAEFTDEHEFHKLLKRESLGNYSVSSKGMWHGGIHVSELGAGAALDLKYGVRCIADGEVVAFRINRAYLVSQMPAQGAEPAGEARYSTGFALVRHTMEFPKNNKLTFFSLYMHLQDLAGYESDRALPKPAYWMPDFKVTQFAHDKPTAGSGRVVPADQIGLKVRATQPHGTPLCILPRGAQFSISKREGDWGQIKDTQGTQLIAPSAGGYVEPNAANNGWVFLGREGGHYAAEEVMPDSKVDRVVTLETPFQIKAGDLIGHLGRYDSLSRRAENRTVHIEVFCGDGIKDFIRQARDWVAAHGHDQAKWRALGLSSEPTILRVAANTTLYRAPLNQGERPPVTDVIQVIAISELEKNPDNKRLESDGRKIPWWHVKGVDEFGRDIDGWVRQEGFSGGRVTREFAQSWVDFGIFEKPHDPTHTMFATTKAYIDYRREEDVPGRAALGKLSPLMAEVYRAIFPRGDGSRAADELCQVADDPWRALRVSRLLIRHESEWANPGKWQELIGEMEARTGQRAEFGEEKKRIERLVWWDAVKVGVRDLPAPNVFHIHLVGLLGNFANGQGACECGCCYIGKFQCVKYRSQYGPQYSGNRPLERSVVLIDLVRKGEVSSSEQRILVAMSPNEGNLDSVQSYDSEVLTAGAMQKTIKSDGLGEFSTQVARFRQDDEGAYRELFEACGWSVEGGGGSAKMHYTHPTLTGDRKKTGRDLREIIRAGCSAENNRKLVENTPLAVIVHAISDVRFERRQIMDFLERLRNEILPHRPNGYMYSIGSYFQTDLGRATALDHHVNRPGYLERDIGRSLDHFFTSHPDVSRNPNEWGAQRAVIEREIIEHYGHHRDMTTGVASPRFMHLRERLT